jgi:dihydroanticapsin dehydrogenase
MSAVTTKKRVVVVTGGANGIGEAICREFVHNEHAIVVCGDLDQKKGEALARLFDPDSFVFVQVDCGKREDCERLVETAVEHFGGVDVLVNNVGVQFDDGTPIHQLEESVWDKVLDINLKSYFRCSKYAIKHMLDSGRGGAIVMLASVQGLQSQPGIPAYASTKGAILSLTRQLGVEYAAKGIRVNAVCPGTIGTDLVKNLIISRGGKLEDAAEPYPMKRIGRPEEVAHAVSFLASEKASFITGTSLTVDGGIMALGGWANHA